MTTYTIFSGVTGAQNDGPSANPAVNVPANTSHRYTLTLTGPSGVQGSCVSELQASKAGKQYSGRPGLEVTGYGGGVANSTRHNDFQYFIGWVREITPGFSATLTVTV